MSNGEKEQKPQPEIQKPPETPEEAARRAADTAQATKERTAGAALVEAEQGSEQSVEWKEPAGMNRVLELKILRDRIKKEQELMASDEAVEEFIARVDPYGDQGRTIDSVRATSSKVLEKFRQEEEKLIEQYRKSEQDAETIAKKYAEGIPPIDRITPNEKQLGALRGILEKSSNFQTYDELMNLPAFLDQFKGSRSEISGNLEKMADTIVDERENYGFPDKGQLPRTIKRFPDSVQKAILSILVKEGDFSIGSELRTLAERYRSDPSSDHIPTRSSEIRKKPLNEDLNRAEWMRTEAIQKLLRRVYSEYSNTAEK